MKNLTLLTALLLLCAHSRVWAQPVPLPFHSQAHVLDSGVHLGQGARTQIAFTQIVQVPGAVWLRLHFSGYRLGARSYLTITSLQDGGRQRLDARSMVPWQSSSAIFNGDAVVVELHLDPGDKNISFQLAELSVGEQPAIPTLRSQCGLDDDRVSTLDNRIGRISPVGCTGWPLTASLLVCSQRPSRRRERVQVLKPGSGRLRTRT